MGNALNQNSTGLNLRLREEILPYETSETLEHTFSTAEKLCKTHSWQCS